MLAVDRKIVCALALAGAVPAMASGPTMAGTPAPAETAASSAALPPGVPTMADALAGRFHLHTAIPTPLRAGPTSLTGKRPTGAQLPQPDYLASDADIARPGDEAMTCEQLKGEGTLLQAQVQKQQAEALAKQTEVFAHATDGVDPKANYAAHRAAAIAGLVPIPGVALGAGYALEAYTKAAVAKAKPAMDKAAKEASEIGRANARSPELLRFDHLARIYTAKHCG